MMKLQYDPQKAKAQLICYDTIYTIDAKKIRKYMDKKGAEVKKVSEFINFFSINIDEIPKSYYRTRPNPPLLSDGGAFPPK